MRNLIVALVFSFGIVACNSDAIVDKFHPVSNEAWEYSEVFTDTFSITNETYYHNLFINLQITGDYAYQNLYVKLKHTNPAGKTTDEIINLQLAEKNGRWLGSGMGDIITFQIPVLGKQAYKNGTHSISLEQYMRLEQLPFVVAAGIKVEKTKEQIL